MKNEDLAPFRRFDLLFQKLLTKGYFAGGWVVSMPASPPITFTSEEPVGITTLELLVSDVSPACNCRSVCAFPLK